jgi:hypothetical protein
MKREAITSTKLKQLCRYLGVRTFEAVGILESTWHLTARETPRGDIGKLSDEDIAIDYHPGRETELIDALVKAGWLDRSTKHRLLVHDWHQHADDTVDVKLARSGETYANGSLPRMSKLSKEERDQIYVKNGWENRAHKRAQKRTAGRKKPLPEPEPEPCQYPARPLPCQAGPLPGPELGPLPSPEPKPEPFSSSDERNAARRSRGEAPAPRSVGNGNSERAQERKPPRIVSVVGENCTLEIDGEIRTVSLTEAERLLAKGAGP